MSAKQKKILFMLMFLAFLVVLFSSLSRVQKTYLSQSYVEHYSFRESIAKAIEEKDEPLFRYLLSKNDAVEELGGIDVVVSQTIFYKQFDFMKIVLDEYDGSLRRLLTQKSYLLAHIIRDDDFESLEKIFLEMNSSETRLILKKVLKEEKDLWTEGVNESDNFLNSQTIFKKFLSLSQIKKDDADLTSLLNYASGLSNVGVVEELIAYGSSVTVPDENGVVPLTALFTYSPLSKTKRSVDVKDRYFQEGMVLLNWYLEVTNNKVAPSLSREKEINIIKNIIKKRKIFDMLVDAGADAYSNKIDGRSVHLYLLDYEEQR